MSVGIGPTKSLAKVVPFNAKRSGGLHVLESEEARIRSLQGLDISEVWNIGGQYSRFLKSHGIHTVFDFTQTDVTWVQ